MNIRSTNSVTGKQNAVMCLLVAVLNGIFTHVSDACHTIDVNKNDSKWVACHIHFFFCGFCVLRDTLIPLVFYLMMKAFDFEHLLEIWGVQWVEVTNWLVTGIFFALLVKWDDGKIILKVVMTVSKFEVRIKGRW